MSVESSAVNISVVVPVYGGAGTITRLAEGLARSIEEEGWTHELIFVCDRPPDDSWTVARELAATRSEVRAIHLMRNFGQHPATLLGIREARGEIIVTMDEDLQHDPRDVPALVTMARQEQAITFGVFAEPRHDAWRNLTSRLSKALLARYVGSDIAHRATGFRAFPARLREAFTSYRGERVAIDVLLSWSGAPIRTIACAHAPRATGESGYTFRKLVAYLADLLVGYSVAPLRFASFLGLLACLFAIVLGAWVLFARLFFGTAPEGFAFIAISVAFFSGVQLITLGVMGEYLGRLYFSQLGKPQYLVDEIVTGEAEASRRDELEG